MSDTTQTPTEQKQEVLPGSQKEESKPIEKSVSTTEPKFTFFQPINELSVKSYEYSFVTLVGRVLQLQVLGFGGYFFARRFISGSDKVSNPFQNIQLSEELAVQIVKNFITTFNDYAKAYGELLFLVDWKKTLKFISVLQVACFLGNRIRGINIFLLFTLYLFTVPKVYEMKKKEIDQILELIQQKVTAQVDVLVQKIPPQYKEKLEAFFGKKEKAE